jgi:V/A-type H+-transporting ATPase subunit D
VSDVPASRSALLDLREERAAMREGHAFLDEKCLLLAGGILRELRRHATLWPRLRAARAAADEALMAALGRHGLLELGSLPLAPAADPRMATTQEGLMGVPLRTASASTTPPSLADPLLRSPESAACADAFAALLPEAAALAACEANLRRLLDAYRRAARRARALEGVLLPELDVAIAAMAGEIEGQEQEDAIAMRPRAR